MDFYKAYLKGRDGVEYDTIKNFDIFLKSAPFNYCTEVKDVPSNDWHDEDGEEEYIPTNNLKLKAFEITIEWAYKGSDANEAIREFSDFLLSQSPFEYMYDTYNNIKYRNVRLVKIHDDATLIKQRVLSPIKKEPGTGSGGGPVLSAIDPGVIYNPTQFKTVEEHILVFKTTLKVNSPRNKSV